MLVEQADWPPARDLVEDRPDFVLGLVDVSSSLRSRARRLITSTLTLGLMRTASRDVSEALSTLSAALEASGFRVVRVLSGAEATSAGATDASVLLMLRGTDARLQREYYREQLDAWIQSRTSQRAEFVPNEPRPGELTPARRVGLLHAPLREALPKLHQPLRAEFSIAGIFPVHNRRFAAALLAHLCRRPILQAQMLHALRNEYGEKVAFLFAFRTHHQRWLRLPALLGVLLWLCSFVSEHLAALLTPLFGLVVPLWASLMLEGWAAQQRDLASLWGVDELREAEVLRDEVRGECGGSAPAGGGAAQHHTRRSRLLKRCVTIPVLGGQPLLLSAIITGLHALWMTIHGSELHPAAKTALVVLVSAAWGLLVEFFNWHVFHRCHNRSRTKQR
jgi:anoctamin-10